MSVIFIKIIGTKMKVFQQTLVDYVALIVLLLMSGCDNDSRAFSKVGSEPEEVAISFVESIYESNSLEYAKSVSSPRLAGLIGRYRTNRNVQKNLFYQMYDKVDIQSEGQGRAGRQEFVKQATIMVLLKGDYNGDTIVQIRKVKLSREGSNWQVNAVEVSGF